MLTLPIEFGMTIVATAIRWMEIIVCGKATLEKEKPAHRDIRIEHDLLRAKIESFLSDPDVQVSCLESDWIPICRDVDDELERQFGTLDPMDSLESLLYGVIGILEGA